MWAALLTILKPKNFLVIDKSHDNIMSAINTLGLEQLGFDIFLIVIGELQIQLIDGVYSSVWVQ